MTVPELREAIQYLEAGDVRPSGLHFHIGGPVATEYEYAVSLRHVRTVCDLVSLEPVYIDVGGGLPVEGERPIGADASASSRFNLQRFDELLSTVGTSFPELQEVWLENGRYLTARAGALITRVLDRKDRDGYAYVICDGGRINHARMAALQQHDIVIEPPRRGRTVLTTICGPTSAGVDKLGRWMLPDSLQIGDLVLWLNAGAYHIPLETRFSVGLAPVVWFDSRNVPRIVRPRETAAEWWGQWE
jgi:diaminopimelate decarboxylase